MAYLLKLRELLGGERRVHGGFQARLVSPLRVDVAVRSGRGRSAGICRGLLQQQYFLLLVRQLIFLAREGKSYIG